MAIRPVGSTIYQKGKFSIPAKNTLARIIAPFAPTTAAKMYVINNKCPEKGIFFLENLQQTRNDSTFQMATITNLKIGNSFLAHGNFKKAEKAYTQALFKDSQNAEAAFNRDVMIDFKQYLKTKNLHLLESAIFSLEKLISAVEANKIAETEFPNEVFPLHLFHAKLLYKHYIHAKNPQTLEKAKEALEKIGIGKFNKKELIKKAQNININSYQEGAIALDKYLNSIVKEDFAEAKDSGRIYTPDRKTHISIKNLSDDQIYHQLGIKYCLFLGNILLGTTAFRKAIEKNPRDDKSLFSLGKCLELRSLAKESYHYYGMVPPESEAYAESKAIQGAILYAQKKYLRAKRKLIAATEKSSEEDVINRIAQFSLLSLDITLSPYGEYIPTQETIDKVEKQLLLEILAFLRTRKKGEAIKKDIQIIKKEIEKYKNKDPLENAMESLESLASIKVNSYGVEIYKKYQAQIQHFVEELAKIEGSEAVGLDLELSGRIESYAEHLNKITIYRREESLKIVKKKKNPAST